MPNWGTSGTLTEKEIDIMARYERAADAAGIQPQGTCRRVETARAAVAASEEAGNKLTFRICSVTLRDAGKIALIDGGSKKIVDVINTGYAVHISRFVEPGRYLYVIGRDAKIVLIDPWMKKPAPVAEIKVGLKPVRSRPRSTRGYEDRYAIAGTYWPPQYNDHGRRHAEAASRSSVPAA